MALTFEDFERGLFFAVAYHIKPHIHRVGTYGKLYRLAKSSIGTVSLNIIKREHPKDLKERSYHNALWNSLQKSPPKGEYWVNTVLRPFKKVLPPYDAFAAHQRMTIPKGLYPRELYQLAWKIIEDEDRTAVGVLGDACEDFDFPLEAQHFHEHGALCSPACPILLSIAGRS